MTPENSERYAVLKDDPELKHVWEEIAQGGPGALQKYWDDDEVGGAGGGWGWGCPCWIGLWDIGV